MGLMNTVIAVVTTIRDEYNVPIWAMRGRSRVAKVREARQLAIHFIHKHAKLSLTKTGKRLNRDHSTVIHSNQVVANELATNKVYQRRYAFINGLIINKINNG
jgi:chromosomal replication initiation ATPase DnaA